MIRDVVGGAHMLLHRAPLPPLLLYHRAFLPLQRRPPPPPYPASLRRKTIFLVLSDVPTVAKADLKKLLPTTTTGVLLFNQSFAFAQTRNLGFRPSPDLGLFSLLFVLSMALGAVLTLAIISIPAVNAFKRLAASMDKLSKVVSEEVPGTLLSLKLSSMEINDFTEQLRNLWQRIWGNQFGNKKRRKPKYRGRRNPTMN